MTDQLTLRARELADADVTEQDRALVQALSKLTKADGMEEAARVAARHRIAAGYVRPVTEGEWNTRWNLTPGDYDGSERAYREALDDALATARHFGFIAPPADPLAAIRAAHPGADVDAIAAAVREIDRGEGK